MQQKKFLQTLFEDYDKDQFFELRCFLPLWHPVIKQGGRRCVLQKFYPMFETNWATHAQNDVRRLQALFKSVDVYYGVLPRFYQRGTNDSIKQGYWVWADIDTKDIYELESRYRSVTQDFPFIPTLVVNSGYGLHCYWNVTDIGSDIRFVSAINRKLSLLLDSDCTTDLARVLRLPLTDNCKVKPQRNHEEASTARVIFETTNRYTRDQLITKGEIDSFNESVKQFPSRAQGVSFDKVDTPSSFLLGDEDALRNRVGPMVYRYITEGVDADVYDFYKGDRSSLDMAVINWLVELDFTDDEIYWIFSESSGYAIAEKVLEKTNSRSRDQYLARTIDKARLQRV